MSHVLVIHVVVVSQKEMTTTIKSREKMPPREEEAQQGEGRVSLLLRRTQRNKFTSGVDVGGGGDDKDCTLT